MKSNKKRYAHNVKEKKVKLNKNKQTLQFFLLCKSVNVKCQESIIFQYLIINDQMTTCDILYQ